MRKAVPDWEVPEVAWNALANFLQLPDPDDVHVLAAAIAGHADCIVTANTRDFPKEVTSPYGIEVVDPDTFLVNQWDLEPLVAIAAFKRMRARRQKPELTPEEFADALERNGLSATVERIRSAIELI